MDKIGGRVDIQSRELAGDLLLLSGSPRRTGKPVKTSAPSVRASEYGAASSASRVILAPDAVARLTRAAVLSPRGVLRHRRRENT